MPMRFLYKAVQKKLASENLLRSRSYKDNLAIVIVRLKKEQKLNKTTCFILVKYPQIKTAMFLRNSVISGSNFSKNLKRTLTK